MRVGFCQHILSPHIVPLAEPDDLVTLYLTEAALLWKEGQVYSCRDIHMLGHNKPKAAVLPREGYTWRSQQQDGYANLD